MLRGANPMNLAAQAGNPKPSTVNPHSPDPCHAQRADLNGDNTADAQDAQLFVNALLT